MEITACNPKEMYNSTFLRFLGLVPSFWKLEVTFCRIDFTLCNPKELRCYTLIWDCKKWFSILKVCDLAYLLNLINQKKVPQRPACSTNWWYIEEQESRKWYVEVLIHFTELRQFKSRNTKRNYKKIHIPYAPHYM